MAYGYVLDYHVKPVISWPNFKIQEPVVSARQAPLYNIQLPEAGKTEMKKAASTLVRVLATLLLKWHLKVILILERFLLLLQTYAAEQ